MGKRVGMLDEVRGITYILMIIYHLYYDLAFVYALAMPDAVHVIFRIVQPLSNIFLFVAGASSVYSSNNFKRGTKYFFLAMLLTFVTAIAMPSEAIVFGVLHFLGIAAMIYGFIGKFTESIPSAVGVILFSLLFVMTYNLPRGYLGIEGIFSVPLPDQLYSHFWLFPLGFSTSGFVSSDYFPLLPYLFIFLAGASFGVYLKTGRAPKGLYKTHFSGLSFLGRHGLWIYLLHQPVMILILDVIFKLTGQRTLFL